MDFGRTEHPFKLNHLRRGHDLIAEHQYAMLVERPVYGSLRVLIDRTRDIHTPDLGQQRLGKFQYFQFHDT